MARRWVVATAATLVIAVLVGVVGLAAGEAVPDTRVADRLHDAVIANQITDTSQHRTRLGNISDHFTECIGLSVGLGEQNDAGFLETLAENPHLGPCDRLVPAIHAYGGSGSLPVGRNYLRYWHGYSALTRPLIATVGVAGLRVLAFAALVASLSWMAVGLHRLAGWPAPLALLTPLVLTSDLVELPQSATQTLAVATGIGGAATVLAVARSSLTPPRVWFASLLAGVTFVYVDILTVVPGMWILPAAVVAFVARFERRPTVDVAVLAVTAGVGWIVGYLGMWVGKWAFSASVLGLDRVRDDVGGAIEARIDGESPWAEPGFGEGIAANLDRWFDQPLTAPIAITALAAIVVAIRQGVRRAGIAWLPAAAVAASPAAVPFAWFEVASNHSQIHDWFTYRSLPIALGVVVLAGLGPPPTSVAPETSCEAKTRSDPAEAGSESVVPQHMR